MKKLIEQFSDNNFLITTRDWFLAPDGKQYKAVWGKIKVYTDQETLGVKTNAHSTNWYLIVGDESSAKRMVVAGCQVYYAMVCLQKPNVDRVKEIRTSDQIGTAFVAERDSIIYLAQD